MMSSHSDSFVASGSSPTYDFIVDNDGTIFLLQPRIPAANFWIVENLPDRMAFGGAVAVAQTNGLVMR
jgi:hypothetical protein